jgi:hypothetical protein
MPYGMPSGEELRKAICGSVSPNGGLPLSLANLAGTDPRQVVAFAHAFLRSGQASIDAFLERANEEEKRIGKLCIAAALCTRENAGVVFSEENEDHWYKLLWGALCRDVTTPSELRANQVRIITFNYDRSLEFFLSEAVRYSYRMGSEIYPITTETDGVKIHHVYGALGPLGMDSQRARTYDATLTRESLELAANGIHVIPEARGEESFGRAREWIGWAETICFLGFGFDFLNLDRLDIPSAIKEQPRIVASVLGKTDREIKAYRRKVNPNGGWETHGETNSMTLRNSGLLLP